VKEMSFNWSERSRDW